MRMWILAIAVAIAGATLLDGTASVDLSKTIYTGPQVPWLSHIVGGLIFGFGMTLASGDNAQRRPEIEKARAYLAKY